MRRVLIDLTDIETWQGFHGGTQRVVYGIAKQFFLTDGEEFDVEFMAFSQKDRLFYITSFSPIYERVENQVARQGQAQPAGISSKTRVKQLVRPYVPKKLRQSKRTRASAAKALRLGGRLARKTSRALRQSRRPLGSAASHQRIEFMQNDIVLILGKPWDSPGMERALTNAKANKGFVLAQVIYDLIIPLYPHLHHPSLFKSYTQYAFEAIYASDLLLPISKSSDKDLKIFAKTLNLPTPKTNVIRLADEVVDLHTPNDKPDDRIADMFISCVGTVEIRKNHTLLYYVYKLAEQQGIDLPQLIIVGSRGWLTNDFQYLVEHDPKVKDKIIILDNVSDRGLSWVYANSLFSVYPSFYEGWGLPVAEALANGKACIASNTSSIPEITGNIIDYFEPYDAQVCLDLMVKYLDPVKLKEKEDQIKMSYKTTSWTTTSKQVSDAIGALLRA